ncbi:MULTISPECIES: DUF397 domain-containing protein [unclassified Streptomyces]|uniref:DUF397 domain-containing protein n=1 Tax=unclassified Streptomyces TaxID=2593676 RepID=UPI002DD80372|nr:DUF397 domain-containing protein [Streptomyces sp. NBC_01795]WSA94028.1 DUF397 domain-containing protein [Streptomyces sp. NBC_01795]WSS42134.1 DUF397 domain-containing protein [Streptomyces sp. NBC_01187]
MTNEQEAARLYELSWFKSSYSGPDGGDCVEVAHTTGAVHVRDSKEQRGPVLSVPPRQWATFIESVAR